MDEVVQWLAKVVAAGVVELEGWLAAWVGELVVNCMAAGVGNL